MARISWIRGCTRSLHPSNQLFSLTFHRDTANGASEANDTATFEYMKSAFTAHYNGNRPLHPPHSSSRMSVNAPKCSTPDVPTSLIVWIVNNEQLLAWVQNPVPVSQLNSVNALKCSAPDVPTSLMAISS